MFASVPNIEPADILFTPSFAPRAEYAYAFDRGVNVTIDSLSSLQQWPDLFADRNIILRIDPGFGQGHHAKVRTGGKEAKFGLAVNDVPAFEAEVKKLNSRIVGLHSHIGSGIVDAQHWATVYAQLAAIADRLGTVSSIDVGGGIAIPYKYEDAEFDLQAYGAVLAELKLAYPQYQCWVEPGRFMVAQAGVLLTKVTQTNSKQGVRRIGLDAGMNALMRPALYDAWHEIVNLSRLHEPDGAVAEIVGPICESSDVLGHRRCLPNTTSENDIVVIANAGAYGYVMANRYNLRELPQEEIIDD